MTGSLEPEKVGIWVAGEEETEHGDIGSEFGSKDALRNAEKLFGAAGNVGLIDLWTDELLDDSAAAELRREGIALVVPVRSEEETYGTVFIGPPLRRSLYTNSQLSRAAELCWQSAVAIQNAKLMERVAAESVAAGRNTTATQVAHDLKSPLRSIAMIAERAREGDDVRAAQRSLAQVEKIATEAQGVLADLVETETKGGARRIGDVIADAAGPFQHLHQERLLLRLDKELPTIPGEHSLALKRVLQNLLDNAFAACETTGTVELYARCREGEILIDVIDDGEGMLAEAKERAFEWGYTTKDEGHGIGLPTCQALVNRIEGTIEVRNAYSGGTKMRVRLPREAVEVERG